MIVVTRQNDISTVVIYRKLPIGHLPFPADPRLPTLLTIFIRPYPAPHSSCAIRSVRCLLHYS